MLLHYIVKFSVSLIEFFAITILTLSLFRFPLKYHYYKYIIISFAMTAIQFYLRDIVMLREYAVPSMLTAEVILITLLFNLPVYYSLLITFLGSLLGGIIEYGIVSLGTTLGLTSPTLIRSNILHSSTSYLIVTILLLVITYYIRYRKFGFHFMTREMTMKNGMKKYNFAITAILVLSMLVIQLTALSYSRFTTHGALLIGLCVFFLIGITIAYRHNKKLLRDKHERLKNR
ncbi:hypothetical protein [Paenibacillus silviterrae]|uniref:hypothetical protein n=1 Tax=Paenibacillus silviterrae TaxID=3242194 RepID=UPI0025433262|nr:hypothetical protein [Paenibacillus chinjuensis]